MDLSKTKKWQKDGTKWLQKNLDQFWQLPPEVLKGLYSKDRNRLAYVQISSELYRRSYFLGIRGAQSIISANPTGWLDLAGLYQYAKWSEAVLRRLKPPGGPAAWNSALRYCTALMCSDMEFAKWLGNDIVANTLSDLGRSFEFFVVKLHTVWQGQAFEPLASRVGSLRVYQRCFDHWNDDGLADALKDICDYHFKSNVDKGGLEDPFSWSPYQFLPVEIFAIKRVRELQGLTMPTVDHPLMQTPLAAPPDPMPTYQDEVLMEAIQVLKAELSINEPWA